MYVCLCAEMPQEADWLNRTRAHEYQVLGDLSNVILWGVLEKLRFVEKKDLLSSY